MSFSEDIICKPSTSVLNQFLKKMNANKAPIVAILNSKEILIGIITDGDIRRSYELGVNLEDKIIDFANTSPKVLKTRQFPLNSVNKLIAQKYIALPVVDENLIFQYFTISKTVSFSTYDNLIIIMAGGFGKSLNPILIFVQNH